MKLLLAILMLSCSKDFSQETLCQEITMFNSCSGCDPSYYTISIGDRHIQVDSLEFERAMKNGCW